MKYIPPERIKELRKLDILTYFRNYRSEDLLRYDENAYVLRCNSAVRIEKGYWSHWNRKGRIKESALDYLIEEENYTFLDAAGHLQRLYEVLPPVKALENDDPLKHFRLPWDNGDASQITSWLVEKQGFSRELIEELLSEGKIYEEKYTHHIVFPAFSREGKEVGAFRKSITHPYGETVPGSLPGYSFTLKKEGCETLHLFSDPLQLLRFADTQRKRNAESGTCMTLLPLGKQESFFLPMLPYLKEEDQLRKLLLHFDRDSAGIRAAEKLKKLLGKNIEVCEWTEEKEES